MTLRFSIASLALIVMAGSLSGCLLRPPAVDDVTLRASAPLAITDPPATDSAGGVPTPWPEEQWWRRYQDPVLDALLERALQGAPTLNTASARFATAVEGARVTGAAKGLQVAAQGQVTRQRLSDNGLLPPEFLGFNWYDQMDIGINATYTFDWWGKQRASIESAVDEARAAQAEGAAARLALASAVAQAYFGWQADSARLDIAREQLAVLERRLLIATRRTQAELESGDAVLLASQDVAATRELIALIEGSQRLRIVTLAALLGVSATELPPLQPQALPHVAAQLPANLTLDLIARRPEIQASRWRVEAARQQINAARAEYYPDVSLRALAGLSSIEVGRLLEPGSGVPLFSAAIHLPLFDSGLLGARFDQRRAQTVAAIAAYDQAVVDAAREVGQAATRMTQAAAQREQRLAQQAAADELLRAAAARARAGTTDLRPQLQAQLALLRERDATAQFDHALIDADIALQQALGGGYDSGRAEAGNPKP